MTDDAQLLGPARIRALAERLDVRPTKRLGQNFVVDANTVRRIVALARVEADDRVLEVGPGLGSLTLALTATGAAVTAVEIDARLAAELPATVRELQPEARLDVVTADAMRATALPTEPDVLVANLPYNVSVPVLLHLLPTFPTIRRALVMVQAEVGERIAAAPGSRLYGVPSVKAAWYGRWSVAGVVPRQVFWPVPNVDSVLVAFERMPEPGSDAERARAFQLVDAAFGQRRKMLRSALAGLLGADAGEVLARAGVDPTARGEQLGLDEWLALARATVAG